MRFWTRFGQRPQALVLTAALGAVSALAAPAAHAATHLKIEYEIALGGFDFAAAFLDAAIDGPSYALQGQIRTAGIPDAFFRAVFNASSKGAFAENASRPRLFLSDYADRYGARQVELSYDETTLPHVSAEPPYGDNPARRVFAYQKRKTQDPASVALLPVSDGKAHPCDRSVRVYDGRRRYDLKVAYAGPAEVDTGPQGYRGPAVRCRVTFVPVAGYKRKEFLEMLKDEDSVTVWLAPVEAGRFFVPVRMILPTPLGGAVARASSFVETAIE